MVPCSRFPALFLTRVHRALIKNSGRDTDRDRRWPGEDTITGVGRHDHRAWRRKHCGFSSLVSMETGWVCFLSLWTESADCSPASLCLPQSYGWQNTCFLFPYTLAHPPPDTLTPPTLPHAHIPPHTYRRLKEGMFVFKALLWGSLKKGSNVLSESTERDQKKGERGGKKIKKVDVELTCL